MDDKKPLEKLEDVLKEAGLKAYMDPDYLKTPLEMYQEIKSLRAKLDLAKNEIDDLTDDINETPVGLYYSEIVDRLNEIYSELNK